MGVLDEREGQSFSSFGAEPYAYMASSIILLSFTAYAALLVHRDTSSVLCLPASSLPPLPLDFADSHRCKSAEQASLRRSRELQVCSSVSA